MTFILTDKNPIVNLSTDDNGNRIIEDLQFEFTYNELPYRCCVYSSSLEFSEERVSVDKLVQGLDDNCYFEEIGHGFYDDSIGGISGDELTISDDDLTTDEEKDLCEKVLQQVVDLLEKHEVL